MFTQLDLPGFEKSADVFVPDTIEVADRRLADYLLFFAIFPAPDVAERLSSAAVDICHAHALPGPPTRADRLHITLRILGRYEDAAIPQIDIDRALAAAANVACPELPVTFDKVGCLERGGNAFVWHCDAASRTAFARLEQALLVRLGHRPSNREPHMTLLYSPPRAVAPLPIEPLRWTATRFALILSHRGLGHHQWIGEWALGGLSP
jgi:RNA 2',3'-cyclic 3'-phosphodiesterase